MRLVRLLTQHRSLPLVLAACPELLTLLIGFLKTAADELFLPARTLLRTGKPTHGLLNSMKPDEQLPYAVDYLVALGGLGDSLCRRRDQLEHPEFAPLMTAVDEAQWPVLARFDVYNQLKLWSGHGAGGQTVRAAEEVERSMLLKQVRRASERELLARKLERGALRRMRYVHWAAAQLLSACPVLPLHEARVEMETEMTWASDGERAAPFTLLRPLLLMHFDAVLPIFLLCAHNDDVVHAALFEAALSDEGTALIVAAYRAHACACTSRDDEHFDEELQVAQVRYSHALRRVKRDHHDSLFCGWSERSWAEVVKFTVRCAAIDLPIPAAEEAAQRIGIDWPQAVAAWKACMPPRPTAVS